MEPANHAGPLVADVDVALGQEPEHLGVVASPTVRSLGARTAATAIEWASLGSFLLERSVGQHPDARGQSGGHIDHDFTSVHELLGQQITQPAGGLSGPGALLKDLGPSDQLVHLTARWKARPYEDRYRSPHSCLPP